MVLLFRSGTTSGTQAAQGTWCTGLGYSQSKVNDLTNASSSGWTGANPPSGTSSYSRIIGAGLFSEWEGMSTYTGAGFNMYGSFWTSDVTMFGQPVVRSDNGMVFNATATMPNPGICAYP